MKELTSRQYVLTYGMGFIVGMVTLVSSAGDQLGPLAIIAYLIGYALMAFIMHQIGKLIRFIKKRM